MVTEKVKAVLLHGLRPVLWRVFQWLPSQGEDVRSVAFIMSQKSVDDTSQASFLSAGCCLLSGSMELYSVF